MASPRFWLGRLRQKHEKLRGADGGGESGADSPASARHDCESEGTGHTIVPGLCTNEFPGVPLHHPLAPSGVSRTALFCRRLNLALEIFEAPDRPVFVEELKINNLCIFADLVTLNKTFSKP
jgi:hypothetical protein